jgi:hypothetical protein
VNAIGTVLGPAIARVAFAPMRRMPLPKIGEARVNVPSDAVIVPLLTMAVAAATDPPPERLLSMASTPFAPLPLPTTAMPVASTLSAAPADRTISAARSNPLLLTATVPDDPIAIVPPFNDPPAIRSVAPLMELVTV